MKKKYDNAKAIAFVPCIRDRKENGDITNKTTCVCVLVE